MVIEEIKSDHIILNAYKEIHMRSETVQIDGKMYIGNINVNEVIQNAPPNLDTLKELAERIQNTASALTGNVNLNGLIVSGNVNMNLNANIANNLDVLGNINVNKNLTVSQNTILANLITNGNVSLNSNVGIIGNLKLTTLGTGVLHSINGVISSSNVVTSDIENNSVSYAKIQTLLSSNVLLGGNIIGSTIRETKVYTDMIADGAITASKLAPGVNLGGSSNLSSLTVSGNVEMNSNASVTDNLTVLGNTILANLHTHGNVSLNSNVGINGNLKLTTLGTGVLHSINGVISSSNVVTSDIQNNSVSYAKMQTLVSSNVLLGGNTIGSTISETKVYTDMIADGAITASKLAPGAATQTLTFTEGSNISSSNTIDNYNIGIGSFYKLVGSIASTITGLADGSVGRYIVIINNTDKNQTFSQEDVGSNPSNRFVLGVSNKTIGINQAATFIYVSGLTIGASSGQSRWVLTGTT